LGQSTRYYRVEGSENLTGNFAGTVQPWGFTSGTFIFHGNGSGEFTEDIDRFAGHSFDDSNLVFEYVIMGDRLLLLDSGRPIDEFFLSQDRRIISRRWGGGDWVKVN